jgi:hypothetical protein
VLLEWSSWSKMLLLNRQGSYAFCQRPLLARICLIFVYQCQGLQQSRAFEQPVLNFYGIQITDRWFNNCDFIRGKNTLIELILAVSLLEFVSMFDGHADKKAHHQRTGVYLSGLDHILSS